MTQNTETAPRIAVKYQDFAVEAGEDEFTFETIETCLVCGAAMDLHDETGHPVSKD